MLYMCFSTLTFRDSASTTCLGTDSGSGIDLVEGNSCPAAVAGHNHHTVAAVEVHSILPVEDWMDSSDCCCKLADHIRSHYCCCSEEHSIVAVDLEACHGCPILAVVDSSTAGIVVVGMIAAAIAALVPVVDADASCVRAVQT